MNANTSNVIHITFSVSAHIIIDTTPYMCSSRPNVKFSDFKRRETDLHKLILCITFSKC